VNTSSSAQRFLFGFDLIGAAASLKKRLSRTNGQGQQQRAHVDDHADDKSRVHGQSARINRFEAVSSRLKSNPGYESLRSAEAPCGRFHGRPLIGEKGPINGGVYLSSNRREAVVVDEQYGLLEKMYGDFMLRLAEEHGSRARNVIERAVMHSLTIFLGEKLALKGEDRIKRIAEKHKKGACTDRKIALDVFIEQRAGSARHQVLLGAYIS